MVDQFEVRITNLLIYLVTCLAIRSIDPLLEPYLKEIDTGIDHTKGSNCFSFEYISYEP